MMNPTQAAEISRRAHRQASVDITCACDITTKVLADLADAYLNSETRHAQIVALIPGALMAWACNYRKDTRAAFAEIAELAKDTQ